jgi:sec-independent protein translocase protein TatB
MGFNVGMGELVLIMVLALVVLGPDKLPNAARQAGRWMAELRRISGGFQSEFRRAMDSAVDETSDFTDFKMPDLSGLGLGTGSAVDTSGTLDKDVQVAAPAIDEPTVNLDKADISPPAGTVDVDVDGPTSSFS